jgi:hypothetical protein
MPARTDFSSQRVKQALEVALSEGAKLVMFELQANLRRILDNEGRGKIYSRNESGEMIMRQLGLREGQLISDTQRLHILMLGGRRARRPRGGQFSGMTATGGRIISAVSQGRAEPPRIGQWVAARGLREKKVGIHRASLPGDPPAKDTGRLVNSTQTRPTRIREGYKTGWRLTLGVRYAYNLEYGVGVARRPFVGKAMDATRAKAPQLMRLMLARFGFSIP